MSAISDVTFDPHRIRAREDAPEVAVWKKQIHGYSW